MGYSVGTLIGGMMFKVQMNPVMRILINFLISVVLFTVFIKIGWINLDQVLPLWAIVAIVSVINVFTRFVVDLVMILALPVILVLITCTLGLGLFLLMPAISYATLYLTSAITGLFTMTTIWWQALIIGAAFGLLCLKQADNK